MAVFNLMLKAPVWRFESSRYSSTKIYITMSTKKHFHRENCQNLIRMAFTDSIGRVVILSGIHAFEWQVTIFSDSVMTTISFPSRKEALKEYNRYRRKR